ncbi:hypothetical protein K2173_019033 [Erythroxylum novogranatense]|uniref:Uncharacterized protein n=1 Tax=Erythroxylum novogranatense TaxID=1862640 RepID=A0AAV8STI3_9ROSI|nr:hypothetical protein K2173_019033 [Erythroxylum novogranatense]
MANTCDEHESRVCSTNLVQRVVETETPSSETNVNDESFYPEADDVWARMTQSDPIVTESNSLSQTMMKKKKKKKKNQVLLEGYVELANDSSNSCEDDLKRAKSLTDDDLDELKGCLDLGFGFSYDEIPELCNTLPALELCYSMSQKFLDEHTKSPDRSSSPDVPEAATGPIANWKISSPGDHPEDVKARLKFWAQAVACTVRLCS